MDHVSNDFFEEDEPLDKIVAAFAAAPKIVTAPPVPGGGVVGVVAATFGSGHAPSVFTPSAFRVLPSFGAVNPTVAR